MLIRIFMMERFLERIAASKYRDNFIIKGGILITSLIGVNMRSTMDIDSTVCNFDLSEENVLRIISEISEIDLDDGTSFVINDVMPIMENREYPGIRIVMDAIFGKTVTPIKMDISTGDVITPKAIEYSYKLMLEDRSIMLWSYNLETIIAEKLQTILSRGVLNTRMRDFYDIYELEYFYKDRIQSELLGLAFKTTCNIRGTESLLEDSEKIIRLISEDNGIEIEWKVYQKRSPYAKNVEFSDAFKSVQNMIEICKGYKE